jgi:hypothetical protein
MGITRSFGRLHLAHLQYSLFSAISQPIIFEDSLLAISRILILISPASTLIIPCINLYKSNAKNIRIQTFLLSKREIIFYLPKFLRAFLLECFEVFDE